MTHDEKKAHPLNDLYVQYTQACKQRDAVYAKTESYEKELTQVNEQIAALQKKQAKLSQKIDAETGVPFIQLKKRISTLARALSAPGGLLAS